MDGNELYGLYQNQLIEIEFKNSTESFSEFGAKIIGYVFYPMPNKPQFFEDVRISDTETHTHQLVRLPFKLSPGFKMKFGISDEIQTQLFENGFSCKDVQNVSFYNEISLEVFGSANNKNTAFSVSGVWSFNQQTSNVILSKKGEKQYKIQGNQFYALCNEIRGCKYTEVEKILSLHKINLDIDNSNIQEIDLLKSLCNIFVWLEFYFVESDIAPDPDKLINNNEFLPKMFNEFIIDFTSNTTTQKDIFLLKHEHQLGNEKELLEELMNFNLLSKVALKVKNKVYVNYFIPFTKLDYRDLFLNRRDLLSFYDSLMKERDKCLSNFYNNR